MDRLFQLTTKNLLGVLNLVLVVLCAYAAALIVHDLRRPAPELKAAAATGQALRAPASPPKTFNAYKPILDRNLFKSALQEVTAPPAEAEVPEEVEESPLQAKLIATIATHDQKKSTATIEDLTSREREVYRVDDTLMKEARIVRIERKRVIVLRNGAHEKLSLYEEDEQKDRSVRRSRRGPAGSIKAPGGLLRGVSPPSPRGAAATGAMNAVSQFNARRGEFRVMPNFNHGRVEGFRIFAVTPGSSWAKSGLRNGDIIRSINGRKIEGTNNVAELLSELGESDSLRLDIKRGDRKQQIRYGGDG